MSTLQQKKPVHPTTKDLTESLDYGREALTAAGDFAQCLGCPETYRHIGDAFDSVAKAQEILETEARRRRRRPVPTVGGITALF